MVEERNFLDKNPLNFVLYYENYVNLNTIYLDDGYDPLRLYLEIFNLSNNAIQLTPPAADSARNTIDSCNFCLQIPKGVLKIESEDEDSILSDDNWEVKHVAGSRRTPDQLFISRKTVHTIQGKNPNDPEDSSNKIVLTLKKIKANPKVQTRASNIKLAYGGLTDYNPSLTPAVALKNSKGYDYTLFVINHLGKKIIPLHAGFTGSNTILNDGGTANQLQLQITNIQQADNKRPNLAIGKESRFILTFESGDLTKEWALTKPAQIQEIEIDAVDKNNWDIEHPPNSTRWVLTPKLENDLPKKASLAPGKSIDINISKIKSSHPSGQTKLTIRYEEIPDYWDGDLVCIIEKTPLMYRSPLKATDDNQTLTAVRIKTNFDTIKEDNTSHFDNVTKVGLAVETGNVGIGVAIPIVPLHVKGNLGLEGATNAERWNLHIDAYGNLQVNSNNVEGGDNRLFINDDTGHVGIGTTNPTTKLEVNGTLKATSIVGDGAVVTGMIMMWSGTEGNIPAGWVICNGNNSTPDLRDRFVVGAGGTYRDSYEKGDQGGSNRIILTTRQMPRHTHSVYDPGHSHQVNTYHRDSSTDVDDASLPVYARNTTNQPTTKSATTSISLYNSGSSEPFDNRPPYYALCFIMKVAI